MSREDDFDRFLLQVINETLQYCLGETNINLIYRYLEEKQCARNDIPKNIDFFTDEFEKIVGSGRGQMIGAAKIIEDAITKMMCTKLEINYLDIKMGYFPDQVRKLKEIYTQQ